jgi:hypothetical protein
LAQQLLGYWSMQYFVILFSGHVIFQSMKFDNYDLNAWNDPSRISLGMAAGVSFTVNVCAWVMGILETRYVGLLGKFIGADGGRIASEFTFSFIALAHIPKIAMQKTA